MAATITGSTGADSFSLGLSGATNIIIDLQGGNDSLAWDGSVNYTLVDGGIGTDTLMLGKGITIDFFGGYGTVFKNFESLLGSSVADFVKSTSSFTTADLGAGNDTFVWTGHTGFSSIKGGSGTDTLVMAKAGTLDLTQGYGTNFSGFEVLTGSTGQDFVTAGTGYAQIDLGLGNDTFKWNGSTGFTLINGGDGTDILLLANATTVDFTQGAGTVFKKFETLIGSSFDDAVKITTQFLTVDLGAGNDTFIWSGQTSFTSVNGGNNMDRLLFAAGATLDLTKGYGSTFSNFEVLIGSSVADNVKITTQFSSVDLSAGNDTFTWVGGTNFASISGGLGTDTLVMSSGATLNLTSGYGTNFSNFEALIGSSSNDYVTANTQYTTINLGLSNDTFKWNGIMGFTLLDGGNGTDTLVLANATSADFTQGAGTVFKNFETLIGSSFDDSVKITTQFSTIDLGVGNDTFVWSGQTKFASVNGGTNSDILSFATGVTVDFTTGYGTIFTNFEVLSGSSVSDNVKTTTNFTNSDLSGGNDIFTWSGGTKFVSISGGAGTDTLIMANGGTLDLTSGFGTKFSNFEVLTGSSNNDYVTATTQYTTISLGAGNDTFKWNGITGFAVLDGGVGTDTLLFTGATTVDFVNGNGSVFKNFELLLGSSGDDSITASLKFSNIDLGVGNDTLIWTGGTTFSRITGGSGADTLQLSNAAAVSGKTTPIAINSSNGFTNFEKVIGSSYADTITVASGNVIVDGGAGDDILKGGTGNTTLSGGVGNDTLMGGSGKDNYVFNKGFGQDKIIDMTGNSGDVIQFGTDFTKQNLLITKNGNDLVFKTAGTDTLTLQNWYTSSMNKVNNFTFSDGSTETINNFSWGSDVSTALGTFDIRFDYRFDTAGFFDATKRQVLEEAAAAWEAVIHEDFPIVASGKILSITNPATGVATTVTTDSSYASSDLTIYVGARELGGLVLGRAGPCGWYSNDQRYIGASFEPEAGSLQIDINSNFYYDTTPLTTNDIPSTKIDFLSVAEHEIGHILGIGVSPQWTKLSSGANFIGSNTESVYGGPVALNTGLDHFASTVTVGGVHPLMDPSTGSGVREPITALDIAALKDLGYTV